MDTGHDIKICLNCGDKLLAAAKKCPTCGAKAKGFPIINSSDVERINDIISQVPHPKSGLRPKWAAGTARPSGKVACCPKCGSTSLTANKKGFGIGKAAVGVMTFGMYGAIAGGIGSNKVIVTCLNCGYKWKL